MPSQSLVGPPNDSLFWKYSAINFKLSVETIKNFEVRGVISCEEVMRCALFTASMQVLHCQKKAEGFSWDNIF